MVAPGFPTKTKDPQPPLAERFHDATVGGKNVWYERLVALTPGDFIFREVSRVALEVDAVVHTPFVEHLIDVFEMVLPNDAGCQPRKVVFWKNEDPWPGDLSDTLLLCGETWRDILNNTALDPGVSNDTWDLAREWIACQLNRFSGVVVPQVILDTLFETLVILDDCQIDSFESATAAAHMTTLSKFNNNDNDGLGFSCLLGVLPGNLKDDIECVVPFLTYRWGLDPDVITFVIIECVVVDLFSDPDNSQLPPELTLFANSYTQRVYTLRDDAQPAIEQRAQSA